MSSLSLNIRPAQESDLHAINRVVEAAVMSWQLPERVKRLSLSSYRYTQTDMAHQHFLVADHEGQLLGVATWETVTPKQTPVNLPAALLHGIYVDPQHHHQGIGRELFSSVEQAACNAGMAGILVRAHSEATGFFTAMGMQPIAVQDTSRDYVNRLWKSFHND